MIVRDGVKPLVFREAENTVSVQYSNRGEPYREGVELTFVDNSWNKPHVAVLLEDEEVVKLRNKLNEYLGRVETRPPSVATSCECVFGQYDHLEKDAPLFGEWVTPDTIAHVAAKANYGAARLVTALVRAIESRDLRDGRLSSTLGAGLRKLIESGAF